MSPARNKTTATKTASVDSGTRSRSKVNGQAAKRQRVTKEERRQMILAAGRHVFLQSGFNGTRTRDIAEVAGITEAMMYRHFNSKEELFERSILEPLEKTVSSMLDAAQVYALVDSNTGLAKTTEIHRQICATMIEIVPLLGVALFSDQLAGQQFWNSRLLPLIDEATQAIVASRRGKNWKQPPIDPRLQFLCIFGMYFANALDAHFQQLTLECDEIAPRIAQFVAKGVTQ